jgi:hypothetical protein
VQGSGVRRYRTIVADPPWHYERMVGRTIGGGEGWQVRGLPYGSLTLDEIRALPVAKPDARLFLFATTFSDRAGRMAQDERLARLWPSTYLRSAGRLFALIAALARGLG